MFKNAMIYRLPRNWPITADELRAAMASHQFQPLNSLEMQSQGWVAPREETLVHAIGRQMLITMRTSKKLLPTSVINTVAKAKATEIEDQQGFRPGRKQMKEIKEQVADDLLPRAFTVERATSAWIDAANGWLVIDAATSAKADEVLKLLIKSIDKLPMETLRVKLSPAAAMTDWLVADTAPAGFTVDQDTELRANGEGKATVRYVRHTLEAEDVRRHVATGKKCTRLALTWSDKISFVLTENLTLKRLALLDVLKEKNDSGAKNDAERFDADFILMAGEMDRLLSDLIGALDGEIVVPATEPQTGNRVPSGANASNESSDEAIYEAALKIVRAEQRVSISLVQRHLHIGYNHAARLIEEMEAKGVVSPADRLGVRTIIRG